MPIVNTPSGPIMIDDGASPDVIRKIVSQHTASTRGQPSLAAPKLSADQQEVQRRVIAEKKNNATGLFGQAGADYWRRVTKGVLANFGDELGGAFNAATTGVKNAVQHRNIGEIAHEYRLERDTERQLDQEATQRTGTTGTIAEIAGALANPIGDGAAALKVAGKAVPLLGKLGTRLASAPALVRGISAGANQGAVNAVGADDSAEGVGDLANRAVQGYAVGGATGGLFAGAGVGARRAAQVISDRGAGAADRIASAKIGQMLGKAKMTPADAEAEIAASNNAGSHAVLGDMTPGLQSQSGALAKRPDVPASNDMIKFSRDRLSDRNQRFEDEVNNRIKLANGNDAAAHVSNLEAARKGAGKVDYEQALDGRFHWNHELQDFMDHADPEMHDAMRQGAHLASLHGQDIGQLGMQVLPDGSIRMNTTPSMRVFDYAKKAMDDKIGAAISAKKPEYAAGLSNLLSTFKQHIMDANPDYAPVLAKQRDMFQRADATASGIDFVKRLRSADPLTGPQSILKELDQIRATNPAHLEDVRTGMANAILAQSAKADPQAFIQQSARNGDQRKVLEFVFGGPKPFNDFQKWMEREARGTGTDKVVAPGYQSNTHAYKMADESLTGNAASLGEHLGRGFAFGGQAGAAAAGFRWLNDLRTGMSPHALDAMARALMSDGKGLAGKVSEAEAFAKARKAGNAKWAKRLGKAGQQSVTDYTGN
jgi:hypothetical protein